MLNPEIVTEGKSLLSAIDTEAGKFSFIKELKLLEKMVESESDSYQYEAKLPYIVGYVPDSERGDFDNLNTDYSNRFFEARDQFPGLFGIIQTDLEHIAPERSERTDLFRLLMFYKNDLPKGYYTIAASIPWHIDGYISHNYNGVSKPITYIVSNQNTTEFYEGTAEVRLNDWQKSYSLNLIEGDIDLISESVSPEVQPVIAPRYAIVRLSPLSVHRGQKASEDTTRTFLKFEVGDKYYRTINHDMASDEHLYEEF